MMKILKDKTFSKIHQKTGTEVSFVKFRKRSKTLWEKALKESVYL